MIMQAIYTCFLRLSRESKIKFYSKYIGNTGRTEGSLNDAYMQKIMHKTGENAYADDSSDWIFIEAFGLFWYSIR